MYCYVDPAAAILEVAVHTGFEVLDIVPDVLTAITIATPADVHIVDGASVPNPNWLRPGIPSARQQVWGDALFAAHSFVLIPGVVSSHSWNFVFARTLAARNYSSVQERFALDMRLHPPKAP